MRRRRRRRECGVLKLNLNIQSDAISTLDMLTIYYDGGGGGGGRLGKDSRASVVNREEAVGGAEGVRQGQEIVLGRGIKEQDEGVMYHSTE